MELRVEFRGSIIRSAGCTREEAVAGIDQMVDELDGLGARDLAVEVDLDAGRVGVAFATDASNPLDAVEVGSTMLRTAIHAAGGGTPDWPPAPSEPWAVRLVNLSSGEPSEQLLDAAG